MVYRHFMVPADNVGENGTKVCAYCSFKFVGGTYLCARHITSWTGMRRCEVHLCTEAPKTARDVVKAVYENKFKAREAKRAAEIAAVGAVNGGSDKKKTRMTDFYDDDVACAKQAADEALCLLFAALHISEHHADHPLRRNAVSSIARAGTGYVPPKRRYIGGAGLAKCRQRIEVALGPIAASWRRDGVTVASDMFSDKAGRPQANVLLINDSGAVFVESIDTKMEMKTGGYIAGILRPVIEKVGAENVVALCFDGGSNYAAACKELMTEYPHIEHIPCATHVLDLLMEDIGKMGWAKDIVTRGDTIISFVRNHHFTRGYMRSKLVNGGKGKQVLKPAGTRFDTNYIAINRLCEVRSGLTQMVLSDEWLEWTTAAKRVGADTFKSNILDDTWWTRAEFFTKLMKLPFVVMRKTDSDAKGMMGRLYNLMLQLTEDIRDFLDEHAEGVLTRGEVGDIRKIVQGEDDLYSLYTALCPLIVLLWWMDVTQGQVREWLRLRGSVVTAKLLKLKRAAASFMSLKSLVIHSSCTKHLPISLVPPGGSLVSLPHLSSLFPVERDLCHHLLQKLDNFPLPCKAIARMKIIIKAVVVALSQRAGTDLLQASMEIAEKRISTLERHLEDSRKELEERERNKAKLSELRRQVQEMKCEEQALKRELEQEREERGTDVGEVTYVLARGNAAMQRMQREAGDMVKAVHALKLTVDSVVLAVRDCARKSELVGVNEGLAALNGEVSGHKTASEREMHEVWEMLGGVRERNCETAGVLEQRGRELTEVKWELAAVKGQLAAVEQESLQLEEAASRVETESSDGNLAQARVDLSQQIIAEVDEVRMKFQEKNAKFAALLKQREREFAAVK
ncbi:unnamed protein product [Closterium sp. NIES-64]|nr:unnamed protein product [Closterium sp. NIES-64]